VQGVLVPALVSVHAQGECIRHGNKVKLHVLSVALTCVSSDAVRTSADRLRLLGSISAASSACSSARARFASASSAITPLQDAARDLAARSGYV
jgi:hypothetical protein